MMMLNLNLGYINTFEWAASIMNSYLLLLLNIAQNKADCGITNVFQWFLSCSLNYSARFPKEAPCRSYSLYPA